MRAFLVGLIMVGSVHDAEGFIKTLAIGIGGTVAAADSNVSVYRLGGILFGSILLRQRDGISR